MKRFANNAKRVKLGYHTLQRDGEQYEAKWSEAWRGTRKNGVEGASAEGLRKTGHSKTEQNEHRTYKISRRWSSSL